MTQSYLEGLAASKGALAVTVVVPAKDEAQNLPILLDEIEAALEGRSFEVIVIDEIGTEAEALADLLADFGRDGQRQLRRRITRRKVQDHEDDQADGQKSGDGEQRPPNDVTTHTQSSR